LVHGVKCDSVLMANVDELLEVGAPSETLVDPEVRHRGYGSVCRSDNLVSSALWLLIMGHARVEQSPIPADVQPLSGRSGVCTPASGWEPNLILGLRKVPSLLDLFCPDRGARRLG
jgi:hypothetical protein